MFSGGYKCLCLLNQNEYLQGTKPYEAPWMFSVQKNKFD